MPEKQLSRERQRQLRQNAKGLCSVAACKRKMQIGGRCKAHKRALNDWQNARYHETHKSSGRKCGKCRKAGHYAPRCPQ